MPTCVSWPLDTACCDGWDDYDEVVRDRAEALAWSTLGLLTAGQVGSCPVTMRPCLQPPCDHCAGQWMRPVLRDGQWYNQVCGAPGCSCAPLCEIVFPTAIADIIEVSMDGITLDPSLFRVDNANRLVRTDGECWPSCQDMGRNLGELCTLGITYIPGSAPGPSGSYAAGVLACEFAKACSGGKCRLPSSVTSVARQGVVFEFERGMFPGGLTGIREVDAYIGATNPGAIKLPPSVWSPDVAWAKHRFTTWSAPSPTP